MSREGKSRGAEWYGWGIILALYIIGLIIFFPKMQYPYGDTWLYARNVHDSMESGRIRFAQAQAATPLFQVWLGVQVCKISGGFAFWKLNLLAYIFSFLGALYTYQFIRLFTRGPALALMGALLLIGMPPFFKTSLAFMTDAFFTFGMAFAFYHGMSHVRAHGEGANRPNRSALLAAAGFAIAILSRANALLTYLAFLLYVILQSRKFKLKSLTWLIHLSPLLMFIAFMAWSHFGDNTPYRATLVQKTFLKDLYIALTSKQFWPFAAARVASMVRWAGYFGAVMLPVTLWIFIRSAPRWAPEKEYQIKPREAGIIWFILVPILLLTAVLLMSAEPRSLMLPNTITAYGMGVKDVIMPGARPMWGADFFSIIKFFICIGGILLFLAAMGRILEGADSAQGRALLWWLLISTALFPLLSDIFSDRYLVPLLPLLFVLIAGGMDVKKAMPRWVWVFPVFLIAGSGLLANEYFGWNTALWEAVPGPREDGGIAMERLVDSRRDGRLIDAGVEYTCFRYYSDEEYLAGQETPGREYPWYVYSLALPRRYDVVVREDTWEAEWEIIRRSEYRPFPWSRPRGFAAYAASNEDMGMR